MKISEMENHHEQFLALEATISENLKEHNFPNVFTACQMSFEHILPAIKFRKKRDIQPQVPTFQSFVVICRYAPPFFEHNVLKSLDDYIRSERILAKHDNGYIRLTEEAFAREEHARLIWNYLEQNPGQSQNNIASALGIAREELLSVIDVWNKFGVISRQRRSNDFSISLVALLDEPTIGLCVNCGAGVKGRKELLFKKVKCKHCGTIGFYHLTTTSHS